MNAVVAPSAAARRVLLVVVLALVAAACSDGRGGSAADSTTTTASSGSTTAPTTTAPIPTPAPTATVDPSEPAVVRHGQLSVCGNDLCDEHGAVVQLRGMSTHGLQWYRQCLTDASLDTLFGEWRADLLRVSMYVREGGYRTDPSGFTESVAQLVDEVVERDGYVIVDWHLLDPGDPMLDVDQAVAFFDEMASRQAGRPNVVYEIANEPNGVSWQRIKEYAERVIPVIRRHDPDAVILVGTPAWSSFGVSEGGAPSDVAADPIDDPNVMYTFHFYAASFRDEYLSALVDAHESLPVFVSEFGTQDSAGEGVDDFDTAQRFVDLMARERISWVVWNYSDDERSGAAWTEDTCDTDGPWTDDRLKPAGRWAKAQVLVGR